MSQGRWTQVPADDMTPLFPALCLASMVVSCYTQKDSRPLRRLLQPLLCVSFRTDVQTLQMMLLTQPPCVSLIHFTVDYD